jgi:hypothetical protein
MSETPAERAVNLAAEFLPARAEESMSLPAVRIGSVLVFAYIKDGLLRVSVDLDDADDMEVNGEVPMRICVGGDTVFKTGPAEAPDMECPECHAPAGKPCEPWCIVDQNTPANNV